MAAGIFGDRFAGRREPAWHGLGRVFTEPLTAVEAVREANADFRYDLRPLVYEDGDGKMTESGRMAIVRERTPDDEPFVTGVVQSTSYEVIQNIEIASQLDELLTAEWPVETVGVLDRGLILFISLDAGMVDVAGDAIKQFFLVTDRRDGRSSLKIVFTPVRVVCGNTLVTGLEEAVVDVSLSHRNLRTSFPAATEVIAAARKAQANLIEVMDQLSRCRITPEEEDAIIDAAYPPLRGRNRLAVTISGLLGKGVPMSDDTQSLVRLDAQRLNRISEQREVLREATKEQLVRIADGNSRIASSAWAVYNAVVEVEDYRESKQALTAALSSSLFGERAAAKARAFKAAMSVLGAEN